MNTTGNAQCTVLSTNVENFTVLFGRNVIRLAALIRSFPNALHAQLSVEKILPDRFAPSRVENKFSDFGPETRNRGRSYRAVMALLLVSDILLRGG